MEEEVNTIFTYIGIDIGSNEGDHTAYYIYDPRTGKHHLVTKEQYDKVMKNVKRS